MIKSLRAQIGLVVFVPLVTLIGITSLFLFESFQNARRSSDLPPMTEMAQKAEAALHELQKERGRTAVYLASGHASTPKGHLMKQRGLTDTALRDLRAASAGLELTNRENQKYITDTVNGLEAVLEHRDRIDGKLATGSENLKFYTGKVAALLKVVRTAVSASQDPVYVTQMTPFGYLTEAIEAGGLERAIGGRLFTRVAADGKINPELFLAYFDRLSVEKSYLNKFTGAASPEQLSAFDNTVTGPDVDQVTTWRSILRTLPQTADGQGIDGSVWFATATKRLNLIRNASLEFIGAASARAAEIANAAWMQVYLFSGISILVLVLTVAVSFWQGSAIDRSLNAIKTSLLRIANRDLDFKMPLTGRKDVIGELARAGTEFQENARVRMALEADAAMERDKERMRQNKMEEMVEKFRNLMGNVTGEVDDKTGAMALVAERVTGIASTASQAASSAHEASSTSSESVQAVAAAAQEMSAAIDEINSQSKRATDIIDAATNVAKETDQNVSSLAQAADKIGSVVEMIREIAEQTNLLALNATIEAARAGDAGRGFAVVAAEVKELSDQTSKATEEIANQINAVQGLTDSAVGSIRQITTSIENVMDVTTAITTAVTQQSQATHEISQSITMAADGTDEALLGASNVATSINETADEAETVDRVAREVKDVADNMAQAIEGFLLDIANDVDERRRATRQAAGGEKVKLHADGTVFETYLVNVSDGGAGVMPFEGAQSGMAVVLERSDGTKTPMSIVWASENGVGLARQEQAMSDHESMAA